MTDKEIENQNEQPEGPKSQARQDYEAGQEFLKGDDVAQAANAFHNALVGFEKDGDEIGMANASDKLADICRDRGDWDKALEHLERAYEVCNKHSDRFSLFAIEKKKAGVTRQKGDLDEAIRLYLEILDEYSALRNPQGSVDTLDTLAEIYLENGDREKAADSLRMAAAIHKSYNHARQEEEYLARAAELEK